MSFVKPLIGVSGNRAGREDTVLAFQAFRQRWPRLKAAVSQGAERLFHGSKRPFAGFSLTLGDRDFREQVDSADACVILNPTMNLVGKMSSLIADCPPSIAAFTMLEAGRPVLLVTRPLDRVLAMRGVGELLRAKLDVLATFGIELVPTWEGVLEGSGAGSMRVLTPGQVAVRSGGKHSMSVVGSSAVGGLPKLPTPGDCANCPVTGSCAKYCGELVEPVIQAGAVRVAGLPGHAAPADLARYIDHTLLKATATAEQIRELCAEARQHVFASVCVNPNFVRLAANELRGTRVKVCTVVGFPLGATSTEAKVCETRQAVRDGADEIDMVINIGALKNHEDGLVEEDIRQVVRASEGRVTKVILETALLGEEEKVRGCVLSKRAGAHFVKTSTGFSTGGATVEDVALMRRTVGPDMGVKASGGVRDAEGVKKMIEVGATRIGASASVAIVTGAANSGSGY
jgi:deoxyribose-phosphate aldolase